MNEPRELWVAVLRLDLGIPGARSKKDRRQVVRSLKERLRSRFGVSCVEVGDVESWTRAALGLSFCAGAEGECGKLADEIVEYARNDPGAMLGRVERDVFRYAGEET
ncbi:MAG: DUF503 domain-containing protein [Planctomycetota bacterium]|nr:DUF503 domain-containing protein [Planctomycetota bacterium]